jgi:hypothetical protein
MKRAVVFKKSPTHESSINNIYREKTKSDLAMHIKNEALLCFRCVLTPLSVQFWKAVFATNASILQSPAAENEVLSSTT